MLDGLSTLLPIVGSLGRGARSLASFLAIFWILRGSPTRARRRPVEDDPDAPPPGYRDRVIAGVTAGLVLILLGGFWP